MWRPDERCLENLSNFLLETKSPDNEKQAEIFNVSNN